MLQDQFVGKTLGLRHFTSADDSQHTGASATSACARNILAMLVQNLWRIVVAFKRRQELARLAELDDRMLADIGITRSDLSTVGSESLLRDPTKLLAQRARDRQNAQKFADELPHAASKSKEDVSNVPIKAIHFVGC
jgi:uncharacterized protein YjiS (DUF1127 family)